jgi:hypothetical protein
MNSDEERQAEPAEGENPSYGSGNPDWNRDFDKTRALDYRTDPDMDIGICQACGAYHEYPTVKRCPCGGEVL